MFKNSVFWVIMFSVLFLSVFNGCRQVPSPTEVGPATATPTVTTGVQLISSWGGSGTGNGLFRGCAQLAFDQADRVLYAADSNAGRIQYFDPSGTFIGKWSTLNSFVFTLCINDSTGYIYTTEGFYGEGVIAYNNSRTGVYGYTGQGTSQGAIQSAFDLAVDQASGNLYVAQMYSNSVRVLGSTCNYLSQFTVNYGYGCRGICVDQTSGEIYSGNVYGTIYKYDRLKNFIKYGSDLSNVDHGEPEQIAVDRIRKRIFIAFQNGYLGIMTTDLDFLAMVNTGTDSMGVCVDESTGFVYVSDFDSNIIKKYQVIN